MPPFLVRRTTMQEKSWLILLSSTDFAGIYEQWSEDCLQIRSKEQRKQLSGKNWYNLWTSKTSKESVPQSSLLDSDFWNWKQLAPEEARTTATTTTTVGETIANVTEVKEGEEDEINRTTEEPTALQNAEDVDVDVAVEAEDLEETEEEMEEMSTESFRRRQISYLHP